MVENNDLKHDACIPLERIKEHDVLITILRLRKEEHALETSKCM
jgi:hypothetical protein